MTSFTDYYDELEASQTDSQDELKKKYRIMAMKYHPDKNPNGADQMAKITQAYNVLSDPQQREMYDKFGSEYFSDPGKYRLNTLLMGAKFWCKKHNPFPSFAASTSSPSNVTTSHSPPKVKPKKNTNINSYTLKVELEHLYNGAELPLSVKSTCYGCKGKTTRNCDICLNNRWIEEEKMIKVEKGSRDFDVLPKIIDGAKIIVTLMQTTNFKYTVEGDDIIMSSQYATQAQVDSGFQRDINYFNNEIVRVATAPGELRISNKKIIQNYGLPKVSDPSKRGNLIIDFSII